MILQSSFVSPVSVEGLEMSPICKEAWYREALLEAPSLELEKRVQTGDRYSLYPLGREYLRTQRAPHFSDDTWERLLPFLVEHVNAEDPEIDWMEDFMWIACKTLGVLPDVSKSRVSWAYPNAPEISFNRSWEVSTLGSQLAGDAEDLGMESDTGEWISFRNSGAPKPWEHHNFDLKMDVDDFLQELEDEGYNSPLHYGEPGGLHRSLEQEEAQNEFGTTYNDEVYGDEVDDYHGMPLSTVVGGRFEISLPTGPNLDQILKWMAE